jgi:hypothetical protein
VGIDEAGNDGSAFEVHNRQSATSPNDVVADRGDPAIADEHLRHDLARAVHRVKPPVDEAEITCTVGRRLSIQRDRARPPRKRESCGGGADDGVLADELSA